MCFIFIFMPFGETKRVKSLILLFNLLGSSVGRVIDERVLRRGLLRLSRLLVEQALRGEVGGGTIAGSKRRAVGREKQVAAFNARHTGRTEASGRDERAGARGDGVKQRALWGLTMSPSHPHVVVVKGLLKKQLPASDLVDTGGCVPDHQELPEHDGADDEDSVGHYDQKQCGHKKAASEIHVKL